MKYFDHAATTKIKEEVFNEMLPYLKENFGNPSSSYNIGIESKEAIEKARKQVAMLINSKPHEIYFTSGGTESDNMALKGIAYKNRYRGKHIITSKIEHSAVLNTCKTLEKQGFIISYIDVDKNGILDIEKLIYSIRADTILISIMYANNEIGTIQPIEEISKIAKMYNIIFHTDAVQAAGNIEIDVVKDKIDMLSLSGHKIYGPKGTGVLYVNEKVEFERTLDGGHQEKNKRSGTENVAGIVGIGKAAELARENFSSYAKKLIDLRDYYISEIKKQIPGSILNGSLEKRLPGNCNFSFYNINSSKLLKMLNDDNICVSVGSACNSNSSEGSHVLKAINIPNELLNNSLRITFGDENTKEDVDYLIEKLIKNINIIREGNLS